MNTEEWFTSEYQWGGAHTTPMTMSLLNFSKAPRCSVAVNTQEHKTAFITLKEQKYAF